MVNAFQSGKLTVQLRYLTVIRPSVVPPPLAFMADVWQMSAHGPRESTTALLPM
jgi:hypothetical protein